MRRVFDILDDLERMQALGVAVPSRNPAVRERDLKSRLVYLESCIAHGIVPDARGKRLEPPPGSIDAWLSVPVPTELMPHMSDLAEGVTYCRARLEAGDLEEAERRRVGVEALIASMGATLARSVRPRRGAEARRGTRKCPRIYDWIVGQLKQDPGATNRQLVERFPDEEDDDYLFRDDEDRFADDGNGRLRRYGFNRYVTAARQQLGIARRSPSRTT